MFDKINIWKIIGSHFETLRNDNSKKADFSDFLTFLILPAIISSLLLFFKICLTDAAIGIIITTLSILIGLLFNVIVLIFDIIKRDGSKKIKNSVLKQLLSNISFTVLLSIFSIILTLFTYINNPTIRIIAHWSVFFSLSVFLFTVLMILKRMYLLFMNELEEIEKATK